MLAPGVGLIDPFRERPAEYLGRDGLVEPPSV